MPADRFRSGEREAGRTVSDHGQAGVDVTRERVEAGLRPSRRPRGRCHDVRSWKRAGAPGCAGRSAASFHAKGP